MIAVCALCGQQVEWSPSIWRCPCGGALEFADWPRFDPSLIAPQLPGLRRYEALLPVSNSTPPVTMGEGWTPIIPGTWSGLVVHWKLEQLNPTASYKDRGIAPLITSLRDAGVREVVEDSSGNAGASVAAYAARAGMLAKIFVPSHASPVKIDQIRVYGAAVLEVPGVRARTAQAAQEAIGPHTAYASHVWQPAVLAGLRTLAWEIWEQLGRNVPDWFVAPVGQGTLLLGAYAGFRALRDAGCASKVPRMVAVQAKRCAPLNEAWRMEADHVAEAKSLPTAAEGISISQPVRGSALLECVRDTNGIVLAATEQAILDAQSGLARTGLYVEPTSAVPVAALDQLQSHIMPGETVVVPLTGSGLKSPVRP